jgi:hypothetical protein
MCNDKLKQGPLSVDFLPSMLNYLIDCFIILLILRFYLKKAEGGRVNRGSTMGYESVPVINPGGGGRFQEVFGGRLLYLTSVDIVSFLSPYASLLSLASSYDSGAVRFSFTPIPN